MGKVGDKVGVRNEKYEGGEGLKLGATQIETIAF